MIHEGSLLSFPLLSSATSSRSFAAPTSYTSMPWTASVVSGRRSFGGANAEIEVRPSRLPPPPLPVLTKSALASNSTTPRSKPPPPPRTPTPNPTRPRRSARRASATRSLSTSANPPPPRRPPPSKPTPTRSSSVAAVRSTRTPRRRASTFRPLLRKEGSQSPRDSRTSRREEEAVEARCRPRLRGRRGRLGSGRRRSMFGERRGLSELGTLGRRARSTSRTTVGARARARRTSRSS